eukprot:104608-Amphidinium_carterae.2
MVVEGVMDKTMGGATRNMIRLLANLPRLCLAWRIVSCIMSLFHGPNPVIQTVTLRQAASRAADMLECPAMPMA